MAREEDIKAAAKVAGVDDTQAQEIWNLHSGGADIKQAYIEARGFTNLEAEAVEAEAEAAGAQVAEKVADKASRPGLAAAAVRLRAAAAVARESADRARFETEKFLDALKSAESANAAPSPADLIAKAKEKAEADLKAIEEIAGQIDDSLVEYKVAFIGATGAEPTNNPDALASTVHSALANAKTHHNSVMAAVGANDPGAADASVALLASDLARAKAARDDLAARKARLKRNKDIDDARLKAKEKAKAETEGTSPLGRWLDSRVNQFRLLLIAIGIALVFFPSQLKVPFLIGAGVVAVVMTVSWLLESSAGKKMVGLLAGLAVVLFAVVAISGLLGVDSSDAPFADERPTAAPVGVILTGATFEAEVPHPTETPNP